MRRREHSVGTHTEAKAVSRDEKEARDDFMRDKSRERNSWEVRDIKSNVVPGQHTEMKDE